MNVRDAGLATANALPMDKPPILKISVSFVGLCEVVAFLSLTGTWLGSLGRYHWMLDLMAHFRLQYIVACLLVLLFALVRRRSSLAVVSLISLLWNAQIVSGFHQTAPSLAPTTVKPLRVLTFNVRSSNDRPQEVVEHVLAANADIVCLLEVDHGWNEFLVPLRSKYLVHVEDLTAGNFGIACYTSLPVRSHEIRRFTQWGLPSVLFDLDRSGNSLTFLATHTLPPGNSEDAGALLDHLADIAVLAPGIDGEMIVAGDFNATPWCEGMRLLREKSGLDFHSVDPVWPPTWGLNLPMMIPIDHVLVKGGLTVQKRVIGPDLGSDHRPVLVEIVR